MQKSILEQENRLISKFKSVFGTTASDNKPDGYTLVDNTLESIDFGIRSAVLSIKIWQKSDSKPLLIGLNSRSFLFKLLGSVFKKVDILAVKSYSPLIINNAAFSFGYFVLQLIRGKSLIDLRSFNGIKVGDLIYDTYIRHGNRYREFNPFSIGFLIHMMKSAIIYSTLNHHFQTVDIRNVILTHRVYVIYGIIARIAHSKKIPVYILRISSLRCYNGSDNIFENEFRISTDLLSFIKKKRLYRNIDSYLQSRFSGGIDQHDVKNAFGNKEVLSGAKLIERLQIDNGNKKVIALMPHAFSDAPHSNEAMHYFDYYDWFKLTLQLVNDIENVTWLVKPHPSSKMYGEQGEVEAMVEELSNVNLIPDSINQSSILKFVDSVITVSGTVGIELACLGKKPILAGRSVYSNLGFTFDFNTRDEYEIFLREASTKEFLLNQEEIITAKSALYWYHLGAFCPSDSFYNKSTLPTKEEKAILQQKYDQLEYLNEHFMNVKNDKWVSRLDQVISRVVDRVTLFKNEKNN